MENSVRILEATELSGAVTICTDQKERIGFMGNEEEKWWMTGDEFSFVVAIFCAFWRFKMVLGLGVGYAILDALVRLLAAFF